ncbi:MAG: HD-GYP domain-containing protein [Gemmatimonadota bacterium]|nr:HD-GYP domain-containing protein [Gemmatimonadota bacterium]
MTRFQAFVVCVCSAAVIVTASLFTLAPAPERGQVLAALTLTILGLVALFLVHNLPQGTAGGTAAFVPFLASALIAPSWQAVVAVSCASGISEIVKRRTAIKAAFNVGQTALSLALAIGCYLIAGGKPLAVNGIESILQSASSRGVPFLLMTTVFFAVNTVAVSAAIATIENRSAVRIWKRNTLSVIGFDVIASPIIFVFGWIFARFGTLAAAGLVLPMLGVRVLYKTNRQLEQVNHELLELMVKAIEARDPYTSGHSRRVAHYSQIIARAIGLSAKQVERIGMAALLHDVGKIHEEFAPLLRKPDKLTPDEWAVMKTHPVKSAELVKTVSHLQDLIAPLRHHHENWDGSGYPDGIADEAIPLASRVIIFADTTDAMTTDRPYRKALGSSDVRAEFIRCRGTQFDPEICDRLLASPLFDLLFVPVDLQATPGVDRPVQLMRDSRLAKPA